MIYSPKELADLVAYHLEKYEPQGLFEKETVSDVSTLLAEELATKCPDSDILIYAYVKEDKVFVAVEIAPWCNG